MFYVQLKTLILIPVKRNAIPTQFILRAGEKHLLR